MLVQFRPCYTSQARLAQVDMLGPVRPGYVRFGQVSTG